MFAKFIKNLFGARNPDELALARINTWSDWLQPFPGGTSSVNDTQGAGRDPGYEDAFFTIKDEVTKLSDIDDALIVRSCEQLLKEVGKDLRLAGYYAFARLRQDGAAGFADGLELAAALVERFGQALLPSRAEAKKGALEWFATARMLDQLDRHDAFSSADLERAMAALNLLIARTSQWPEAARPNLQPLVSRFGSDGTPVLAASGVAMPSASNPPAAGGQAVSSARDVLEQTRAIAQYLRAQENGYLPSARLVRCVRWDTIHEVPPADIQGRTRLVAPRAELRQQFKRLVLQKQWHELLERIEGAFMEGANHLWFDLQHFLHIALDHAGEPYTTWRDQLRTDLALLLERLPGVERLAFGDGTPFADDAALEWIARHAVVRDLEAGEALTPLPVSAGSDDGASSDWREMEAQARDLLASQGLDAAFAWLASLPGMRSERQRYLQRWLMARIADHAGKTDTARHLLAELDVAAKGFDLPGWEPSLTFEVKHHLLRVLKASLTHKDTDKAALYRRIEQLQGELTVLDPARAVALA
ncbi:type VI secretion system protein TssA [Trinickia terrae]|uniref:Type VI secretion system protein TssA n=1 Tax=Trinickia terrae TaxID=2571161 RepID=A0A4U1HGI9_9BURK|nr:type VI secretion system protein TssA [Trinickia terrae]TKC78928.1 type VI secretion system protein TssA [Trinickia terrae]